MPTTRRQTTRNTRSSGPASIPNGQGRSTGVKSRQKKAKSKTSGNSEPSSLRSDPDNKEIPRRILWNLVENYFPLWLKIILEPFKSYNETVVFIIIVTILLCYPFWSFRITIFNAVTVFWQERVTSTADLPSVYFNDAYGFTRCPDENMDRRQDLLKNQDGINVIFIAGKEPGLEKSDGAYIDGICLFESLKQSKQDNRPVDVITINVSSESFCVMSIYRATEALCGSENSDCIKQISAEFTRDLFRSESNGFESEKTLKFLFTKLYELITRRNSRAVMILYSWGASDTMELFRLLVPSTVTTNLEIS